MDKIAEIAGKLSEAERGCLSAFSEAWEDYVHVNVDGAQGLVERGLAGYEYDDRQNPLNDPEPPRHYYRLTETGLAVRKHLNGE